MSENKKFNSDSFDPKKVDFGLNRGDKLLLRKLSEKLENNLGTVDVNEQIRELSEYGIGGTREILDKTYILYSDQLVYEGKRFGNSGKIKSGEAIKRRIVLGKRDNSGG